MLNKLERTLGRFAIPQLATLLVAGQAGAFILAMTKPEFVSALILIPERVLQGEVWRVVTFLFVPPSTSLIFIIFALLLLYTYGRALEEHWGEFRFNLFIFVGWAGTTGAAFLIPGAIATNIYLMGSIFFAFAYLYPNFELRLFFILPVKVKWLAGLTGLFYLYQLATGGWATKALVGAGVLNFFLFFGPDMVRRLRGAKRTSDRRREEKQAAATPRHQCVVCGITDLEDPYAQFRYCSKCTGQNGYCMDHLRDHPHTSG